MKLTNILYTLSIIALLALASCASIENPEKVTARLPIPVIEAAFMSYYAGIDQGFYSDEGLDVDFTLGSSQTNPVKMVATGADDFGFLGGPDTLLVARSKGLPLVAIGILHRNSDFPVVITLKDSGLTKVKDLEGKKVGFFYGHISTDVIRNLFKNQNVTVEEVDVGFDYSPLITGKIDASWAWRTTGGINVPHEGYDINIISPGEYGINTHGVTIFTAEDMIKEHPDVVKKFLRGTIKGMDFTLENPEKAIESIMTRNPKLDRDLELYRWGEFAKRVTNSEEYPIGYMDYDMFKETYDRLLADGIIEEFDVNEAFTTKFLDEIYS